MAASANLSLPYIAADQVQKHITHNEAVRMLDAIVHLGVASRTDMTPPPVPGDGDRYIVAAGASGDWAGKDDLVAAFQDGSWVYFTPQTGWVAWVADESALLVFDGEWVQASVTEGAGIFGINTTADATNRLAVKADAVLFSHDDVTPGSGDQRTMLNKDAAADTASLVFQTGFSGRAEFGTAGDDDFHVKVSPDGSVWHKALVVSRDSGRVRFPSGGVREVLNASRTYYVDGSAGSDSNDGLTSGAGAFATLQKAADVVYGKLDLGGQNVTITVADGTYTEGVSQTSPQVGAGTVKFVGNTSTPANCVISVTSSNCFSFGGSAVCAVIDGFELRSTSSGNCVQSTEGASVTILPDMRFGTCATRHVVASRLGSITIAAGYEIAGSASAHFFADLNGTIFSNADTFVLTGTPHFDSAFCQASLGSAVRVSGATFTGTGATGNRYSLSTNAVVYTFGGGPTYFPGDSAGSAGTGGQYI